ncbi:hypothetical protein [Planctomyces sp. SH-PL14]|uniref:hypothetical protein n=1 Tax=Planctomyces sp. SH-PL14 TaxID=1632864 RepID=UPI00078D4E4B|nr:hypothetical protein [Planctomyces sp. SH-PL14]AMV17366.1 hypothetical protein VT03_05710 [Planctomyces sp. SH-PL14]
MPVEGDAIWYYVEQGKVIGPVSTGHLLRLIGEKKFSVANSLSRDQYHWFPALHLPVLREPLEALQRQQWRALGLALTAIAVIGLPLLPGGTWVTTTRIIRYVSPSLAAEWNLLDRSTALREDKRLHWSEIQFVLLRLLSKNVSPSEFLSFPEALPDQHPGEFAVSPGEATEFKKKLKTWFRDVETQANATFNPEQFLTTLLNGIGQHEMDSMMKQQQTASDLRSRFKDLVEESETLRKELEESYQLTLPPCLLRGAQGDSQYR